MTIQPNFPTDLHRVENRGGELHASRLPGTQARQGVTLGRMRFVLGFGLALVIVAFAILYLVFT